MRAISRLPGFRFVNMPRRAGIAFKGLPPKVISTFAWILRSREDTNFTYDLRDANIDILAHSVAAITGESIERVSDILDEILGDAALKDHVLRHTAGTKYAERADPTCKFGRRLGWYAFLRVMRPRVVVETGIDKGLGSVLLCSALLRNASEGFPGKYYGTDINPEAGYLLQPPYAETGKVLYGDSISSLERLQETIDIFINDSDHSADYEYREYVTVAQKLSPWAVILGDNSDISDSLARFSRETKRDFLFFREEPVNHWFRGGGIGMSFKYEEVRAWVQSLRAQSPTS